MRAEHGMAEALKGPEKHWEKRWEDRSWTSRDGLKLQPQHVGLPVHRHHVDDGVVALRHALF